MKNLRRKIGMVRTLTDVRLGTVLPVAGKRFWGERDGGMSRVSRTLPVNNLEFPASKI